MVGQFCHTEFGVPAGFKTVRTRDNLVSKILKFLSPRVRLHAAL